MKKFLFIPIVIIFVTGCGPKKYYCKEGDTLQGDKCIYKEEKSAYKESYCPEGYIIIGEVCYQNGVRRMFATIKYSCPNGGTLQGKKCIIFKSYDASTNKNYFNTLEEKEDISSSIGNNVGKNIHDIDKSKLEDSGYFVSIFLEEELSDKPNNIILEERIEDNQITFIIPNNNIVFPKFYKETNYTIEEIREFCNNYNIPLSLEYLDHNKEEKGTILAQNPEAGQRIAGQTLTITIEK